MNPDIEKLLDQLLHDRRMYNVVDWKAALSARLEDAWNYGYTTGRADALADEGYPKGQQP